MKLGQQAAGVFLGAKARSLKLDLQAKIDQVDVALLAEQHLKNIVIEVQQHLS